MPLLYPIGKKDYNGKPIIANEWNLAKSVLSKAAGITVYGYSAPVTDIEAVKLMKSASHLSQMKDIAPFTIINLAKNEDEQRKKWSEFYDVNMFLAAKLLDFEDVSERIQYLVTQVEEITKIDNFGAYLTAMLEIDAFFMNEDRHTNNIAVIYNEKTQKYELSPFFDQGLCMFADINPDYPIDQSLEYCLGKIEAKPFCSDFDIQLDAAEELYGIQIGFQFTFKDIQIYLQKNLENYPRIHRLSIENLAGLCYNFIFDAYAHDTLLLWMARGEIE